MVVEYIEDSASNIKTFCILWYLINDISMDSREGLPVHSPFDWIITTRRIYNCATGGKTSLVLNDYRNFFLC